MALSLGNETASTTNIHDAATGGTRPSIYTPLAWSKDRWGPCLAYSDSNNFAVGGLGAPLTGATELTISTLCMLNTLVGGDNSLRHLWCEDTVSDFHANGRVFVYNVAPAVMAFQVGTDSAFANLTCDPPPLNVPVLVTCRLTSAGVRSIWYGSCKVAERTDAGIAWGSGGIAGGAQGLTLGNGSLGGSSAGRNWSGTVSAAYVWGRALSDKEIVALATDPFAPVRPINTRAWLPALFPTVFLRVTQEPVRTLILPTDARLRVTQEAMRTLILPTDARLRLSQMGLRVLRLSSGGYIIVPMDGLRPSSNMTGGCG